MKKYSNIILFGLACLVLVGYIFTLRSDIAGQEKKMATLKRERDMAWKIIYYIETDIVGACAGREINEHANLARQLFR